MTEFNNAVADQIIRLSAVEAHVPAKRNVKAQQAIIRSNKVADFISRYVSKTGESSRGFTRFHPAFIQQMYNTLVALEIKSTLAQARGDGRVATGVDNVRSIGSGFHHAAPAIHEFLGLHTDFQLETVRKGALHISVPVAEQLEKSNQVFTRLQQRIAHRDMLTKMSRAEKRRVLDDDMRHDLLLTGAWNSGKIIEYSIEYMARAFANAVNPDLRNELVRGDSRVGMKEVFQSLPLVSAA